jgi:hypothetical protein
MHAAAAEPISPELVLVCPELREHALDTVREFALETAQRVHSHPVVTRASRSYVLALYELAGVARMGLAAAGSVTLVTLVLTLIANALH